MSKITKVNVHLSQKIPVQNYEMLSVGATLEIELEENDDPSILNHKYRGVLLSLLHQSLLVNLQELKDRRDYLGIAGIDRQVETKLRDYVIDYNSTIKTIRKFKRRP